MEGPPHISGTADQRLEERNRAGTEPGCSWPSRGHPGPKKPTEQEGDRAVQWGRKEGNSP